MFTLCRGLREVEDTSRQSMSHLMKGIVYNQRGHIQLQTSNAMRESTPSYHHGDLRSALILEGRRALEQHGVQELSLRQVARAAGVSEAAPSKHFENKEGLLAAIAAEGFRELAAVRLKLVTSATDAPSRLYSMMRTYVQFALANRGLFALMVGPRILQRSAHAELNCAAEESFELFAGSVRDLASASGWAEEDLEYVVHAAWAAEHGLAQLIIANRVPRLDKSLDIEQMVHFTLCVLLGAVQAGPLQTHQALNAISRGRRIPRKVATSAPTSRRKRKFD
jgi:AcrR family transcriptional regulator